MLFENTYRNVMDFKKGNCLKAKGLSNTILRIVVVPGLGFGEAMGQDGQDHPNGHGIFSILVSELGCEFMGAEKIIKMKQIYI